MDTNALRQGRHGKGSQGHGQANDTKMPEFYHRSTVSAKIDDFRLERWLGMKSTACVLLSRTPTRAVEGHLMSSHLEACIMDGTLASYLHEYELAALRNITWSSKRLESGYIVSLACY